MTAPRRVQQQPAYILHHRPFRDSSQILDIVTRDNGKISLVARGSRGSKSRLAGLLRPFLPLKLSWVARSDLGTLTGAEAAGAPLGLRGDAMLSAFYVNELLMNFLHRHDPQPEIYELYRQVISVLGSTSNIAVSLRSFELELLSLLGYAINVDHESGTQQDLDPDQVYDYRVEQGPVAVDRAEGRLVFPGATLRSIQAQEFDDPVVLRAANRLLREVIAHHLGGKELKSRKVLMELHRGRIAPPNERKPESG
ncbi:MAG: DNA repair protein RecO [Gammaproteobacteria bacterium]|nr:DNA repair protein RecO [Gammaproteobacteria bacterium]MBT8109911.1 DNA repair protein RecO [Gammaproteobacteria bacterium]NND47541.1 DNA repair protein RecO [Woeseiaceae bacterium]NNL44613.1 DNA repair protein RecO [Woeseiaceae bacterium]